MVQLVSVVLNLVLWAMVGTSLVLWIRMLWKWRGVGRVEFLNHLVAPRPRRRPFRTIADVMLMFGTMILVTQAILVAMVRKGWIATAASGTESTELTAEAFIASILANSTGGLVAVAVTLAWMRFFSADARREIGLTCSWQDVKLGLIGALMILPPVLLISGAVNLLVPYEHPVLESLAKIATPNVFFATFIGTAIITPLVEEFLTRGLLQGSLQALIDRGLVDPVDQAEPAGPTRSAGPTRHTGPDELSMNPYAAPRGSTHPAGQAVATDRLAANWTPQSYWPLFIASFAFAALHVGGQGAAPIPLFFLSLGLGYLYRQTGSLAPSIIVHMVLNGLTLCFQFLSLSSP